MEFYLEDPKYALQTFSRQSSDYLRHSVLSPKRFGQLEMKLEQKARPPPPGSRIPGGGQGGTSTDLREVHARRFCGTEYFLSPFILSKNSFKECMSHKENTNYDCKTNEKSHQIAFLINGKHST